MMKMARMRITSQDQQPSKCVTQSQSSKAWVYFLNSKFSKSKNDLNCNLKKYCDISCKQKVNTDFLSKWNRFYEKILLKYVMFDF